MTKFIKTSGSIACVLFGTALITSVYGIPVAPLFAAGAFLLADKLRTT